MMRLGNDSEFTPPLISSALSLEPETLIMWDGGPESRLSGT